jgi:hypothetical protein
MLTYKILTKFSDSLHTENGVNLLTSYVVLQ